VATDPDLRAELAQTATRRVESLDLPSAGERTIDLVTSLGT
jgi:hypothetical protein